MLNIRRIREQTEAVKAGLERRGEDSTVIDQLVAWDSERRALLQESEALKAERNRTSKTIGAAKDKEAMTALREQMRAVGQRIKELDGTVAEIEQRIAAAILELPNVPHASVPGGTTEEENHIHATWGEQPQFGFEPQAHWDIGAALDILDFPRGAKIAGAQFPLFKGDGSRLLRALGSWMLDLHV
ncbi:MAG: serine--tRNA ligase, partial [Chloroflexota bacterium]|nr:serine--tRNA ligase [Chloroflexota bacterium]